MRKDDMIRRILRDFESAFLPALRLGEIDHAKLDQAVKEERQRLSQQTYSELERQYFAYF